MPLELQNPPTVYPQVAPAPVTKSILVTVSKEPTIPANPIYKFILDETLYSHDITPINEETQEVDTSAVVIGKTSGATAELSEFHSTGPGLCVKNITGTFVVGEEITVAGKTAKIVSCDISPSQIRVDLIKIDNSPLALESEQLIVGYAKSYPNPYEQIFTLNEGSYKLACYNVYQGWGITVVGDAIIGTLSIDSEGSITSNLPSGMIITDPPVEDRRPV